jgi:hypothetical protein
MPFETMVYLLSLGFGMQPLKDFMRLAQRMLVSGFGDAPNEASRFASELRAAGDALARSRSYPAPT